MEKTIEALSQCKILLYPTDTIWGLSCCIDCEKSVEKIYKIKNRKRNNPLILLVSDIEMLKNYVPNLHPRIETMLNYYDKPLTLIHEDPFGIPSYLLAENGSIGIRIVQNAFCQKSISALGKAIVSTSANVSGDPAPQRFGEISTEIKEAVDFIVPQAYYDPKSDHASKIAKYNKKGELEFLRS